MDHLEDVGAERGGSAQEGGRVVGVGAAIAVNEDMLAWLHLAKLKLGLEKIDQLAGCRVGDCEPFNHVVELPLSSRREAPGCHVGA
jgi:hypothetical protein